MIMPSSTASHSIPTLVNIPQEIINLIVDDLSGQPDCTSTLKNLSLVAHVFRDQCQQHLFRSLTFTVTPYNKLKCSFFVLEEFPHLGEYVTALEIYGSNSISLMIQGDLSFSEELHGRHRAFRDLMHLLPNVKYITARGYMLMPPMEWTYELLAALQSHITSRPTLSSLCLQNVPRLMLPWKEGSVGPFAQPYIIKADISSSTLLSSGHLYQVSLSVRSVHPPPKVIYNWIFERVINAGEVAELTIELHSGCTEGAWGAILQCSSSLEVLTLRSVEYWDADVSSFNLNLLAHLTILIIETTVFFDQNGQPLDWWSYQRRLFASIDYELSAIQEIIIKGEVSFNGKKIPIARPIVVQAREFDMIPEMVHQYMFNSLHAGGN